MSTTADLDAIFNGDVPLLCGPCRRDTHTKCRRRHCDCPCGGAA